MPLALRGSADVTSYAPSRLPEASDDLLLRVSQLYAADPQLHPLWSDALEAKALADVNATGQDPASLGKLAASFHAVVLMDQAGWHMTGKLDVPGNITLIALPAKCPELNPVENIWQFMRDNWLSNLVFTSYDNIVDHCCEAWNKLVDQPWHIMTIGRRKWARGF